MTDTPTGSAATGYCVVHDTDLATCATAGRACQPMMKRSLGIARDAAVGHADLLRRDVALDNVRRLHSERRFSGDGYGWSLCAEDRQQWPCPTERVIREALGETDGT